MNFEQLNQALTAKANQVTTTEALKTKAKGGSFMDKIKLGLNVAKNSVPVTKASHAETTVALDSKIEATNAVLQAQIDELKGAVKGNFTSKEDITEAVYAELDVIFNKEVEEAIAGLNVDGKSLKEHYAQALQISKDKGDEMMKAMKTRNVKEFVSLKKAKEVSDETITKLSNVVSDIKSKFQKKQQEVLVNDDEGETMSDEEFLAQVAMEEAKSATPSEPKKEEVKEEEVKDEPVFDDIDLPAELEDAFDNEEFEEEVEEEVKGFSLKRSRTKVSAEAKGFKLTQMGEL